MQTLQTPLCVMCIRVCTVTCACLFTKRAPNTVLQQLYNLFHCAVLSLSLYWYIQCIFMHCFTADRIAIHFHSVINTLKRLYMAHKTAKFSLISVYDVLILHPELKMVSLLFDSYLYIVYRKSWVFSSLSHSFHCIYFMKLFVVVICLKQFRTIK